MKVPTSHGNERRESPTSRVYQLATVMLSLVALGSTFLLSLYSTGLAAKAEGFSVIIAAFLIGCAGLYLWQTKTKPPTDGPACRPAANVDDQLHILDEAREFFAGALRASDTFRLVVCRISDLVPFSAISLLLLNEQRDGFVVAQSDPSEAKGSKYGLDSGVVGKCYFERDVVIDAVTCSAAVPLKRDAEVFGILHFTFAGDAELEQIDASLLDAIGERVGPLVLGSIAFERSQANALTDRTTELPNERAFHLVLENQVAESIRKGSGRPLTILSFDIKDLDEIGARFGHAASDRILNYVAQNAKDSLRQMDFLTRGAGSEFLAILPTASKEISHEIIARIQTMLFGRKIKVSDIDAVEIELNFGWASFGADGETPATLTIVARERREQSKSALPGSVLWFPHETAH